MRFLYIVLIVLFSCDTPEKIHAGKVEGRNYINESYGLKITFPDGWSVIADHETMKLNGGGDNYKKLWDEATAKPLVVAYKFSDVESNGGSGINSNISVYTEYISPRSEIKSAEDYVPHYKKALAKHKDANYEYIDEDNSLLESNKDVSILDMEFEIINTKVRKKSFLFLYGKQLLNITLTWEKGKQDIYEDLVKSYRSLHLVETKL